MESAAALPPLSFETEPARYRHITLSVAGDTARIGLAVREDEPLRQGYTLKLNSYDLGVDIELADAVQRLRFEHPEIRTVILTSDRDRVFCAGANIHMLSSSDHGFKVNFCKYTNETRLSIEDASAGSGQKYLAAVNGSCAGGGYEVAMACDEILLIDDGSSTVSLPEVALLGVLPGTGGLTRLTDKRKVRRDRADVFASLAEGMRGRRAVEWLLVDGIAPKSRFAQEVTARAKRLAAAAAAQLDGGKFAGKDAGTGIHLPPLAPVVSANEVRYRFVHLALDRQRRLATLTLAGPAQEQVPATPEAFHEAAAADRLWSLRVFRELDDALLRLRFNEPGIGLVLLHTQGDPEAVLLADAALFQLTQPGGHPQGRDWLAHEIVLLQARTLRRLDLTAKSFFAVAEPGSCFAGCLLELLLAADRSYALDDPARPVRFGVGPLNGGALSATTGRSRLVLRSLATPGHETEVLARGGPPDAPTLLDVRAADELGLLTVVSDELDFDDTLRLAIEERLSLSPDALTGMEANLRVPGAEGCDSKIFGRLSAWQNWIFIRPNATGEQGALTRYGKPERPSFDWRRT